MYPLFGLFLLLDYFIIQILKNKKSIIAYFIVVCYNYALLRGAYIWKLLAK